MSDSSTCWSSTTTTTTPPSISMALKRSGILATTLLWPSPTALVSAFLPPSVSVAASLRSTTTTTSPSASVMASSSKLVLPRLFSLRSSSDEDTAVSSDFSHVRVGIIGGGIAGVSAAHALRKRLPNCQIELLEAGFPERDTIASPLDFVESTETNSAGQQKESSWKAATARNGNSIVPGASFFVFSQPSSLWQVLTDTMTEYWQAQREYWQATLFQNANNPQIDPNLQKLQEFARVPPYFALHLGGCLGFSATSTERWSFVRFVQQYLFYTLFHTDRASVRGHQLCQLAQANRNIYLELLEQTTPTTTLDSSDVTSGSIRSAILAPTTLLKAPVALLPEPLQRWWVKPTSIGHSKGFLSVHRSLESAQQTLELVRSMGEEAEMMDWDEAQTLEPRLAQLPMGPLFVVRRPNDFTASCGECVRTMIKQGQFPYRAGVTVESVQYEPKDKRFHVQSAEGEECDFDLLVLAAGIHTPLLASQLGVAEYCPTYPLRGFSLTVFTNATTYTNAEDGTAFPTSTNLLRQPFKVDSMYCSSVSPTMARWVGFGELVGYHGTHISSPGPAILARYAKAVFPDCAPTTDTSEQGTTISAIKESVLPCFRALSPDDLPLVGPISKLPGLFLHTGHGSLGWTIGLATGEVLAAQIESYLRQSGSSSEESSSRTQLSEKPVKQIMIQLSDGTTIDATPFLPERFVS